MNKHSPPLISIIVPHLNQPEYLEACLLSLAGQFYRENQVEIIVVDNGSNEPPDTLCQQFGNVTLITEPTPGPGPARNRGIGMAKASLIAFLDADCVAGEGWMKAILEAFEDPQTQIIGGDVRIALANPDQMTMLEAYESVYAYRQKMYIEQQGFSGTGNLAMRRPVHSVVGPFGGLEVAEDIDWGRRAGRLGYKIHYVDGMKVFHPARQSFRELEAKWDRHTAHLFEITLRKSNGLLHWGLLTVAMALSPMLEIVSVMKSRRISGPRARILALAAVARIRLYRSRKMIWLLFGGDPEQVTRRWNRDPR